MAPSRGKGKVRDPPAAAPRRSTRARKNATASNADATPDVYGEMVAEAVAAEAVEDTNRPLKRRKVSREPVTPVKANVRRPVPPSSASVAPKSTPAQHTDDDDESDVDASTKLQQTAEYSSESEESDFAFEDVDLDQKAAVGPAPVDGTDEDDDQINDVAISVAPPSASKKPAINRRKPATAVEKAFRLRVHKIHFLTLLGHCMYVNSRCNNSTVQKILRRLVDKRMRSYLNPKTTESQFQRNRSFMDGLEQAKAALKAEFRVTMCGMSRPRWPMDGGDDGPSAGGEPMDLVDFATAAKDLEGSQDTGNQLFCAMLRAVGVEARLVCSLQTLPFANAPPKSATPVKKKKPAVFAIASDTDPNLSDASASDGSIGSSAIVGKIPSVRRRLGQPSFAASPKVAPAPKERKKPIRTLSYPVYWVEAFNEAHQRWVPVDPMVTNTVGKPNKIEPPLTYDLNQMMYVVAFEEDGVARDVTRRYAKAFNAKTRRQRVESSGEDGAKWLKAALRPFRRRRRLDRDQVEDSELAQKEAREGLPSNVLDFKGHPYYALERHLRRHEVLHPRREAGKVNAGTAAKPRMEPVFRRSDVLSCKSADKWYRLGREVKHGEQPLKHVPARASRRKDLEDDGRDHEPSTTGLYSIYQTQVYVPPPITNGRITKNAFGNLDVYVPSMVPPGGTHIRHPLTQQAARALKIDFADAVTGFKFQGRQGTAVIEGAVVPEEHSAAVRAVIEGLENEALEDESRARSLTALRLWSRFIKGLRIAERVASYGDADGGKVVDDKEISEVDFAGNGSVDASTEGDDPTMPTAGQYTLAELMRPKKPARKSKKKVDEGEVEEDYDAKPAGRRNGRKRGVIVVDDEEDEEEDEYLPDAENVDDSGGGGFLPEDAQEVNETGGGFVPAAPESQDNEEYGGGFLQTDEDVTDMEGGFLPETGEVDTDNGGGGFVFEDEYHDSTDELFADDGSAQDAETVNAERDDHMPSKSAEPAGDDILPPPDGRPAENEHVIRTTSVESNLADDNAATNSTGHPIVHATAVVDAAALSHDTAADDEANAEGERGSDHDSLLSHDPDDEDAEPDWLESD